MVDYGEFLMQRGRGEEALSYLKEAVQLDPYEERATQLLAELEAMPPEPSNREEESPPAEEESAAQLRAELETAPPEPTSPEEEGSPNG